MKFSNSRTNSFLESIPRSSLDDKANDLSARCKFNFSFFEKQSSGKLFEELSKEELIKLCNKLKEYSREPLSYWEGMPIGSHGRVLRIYGPFPKQSAFVAPKSIPHQVRWGRFRLDQTIRLAGFVVPDSYDNMIQQKTGRRLDKNTFYVVFYDDEHNFYITQKK